MQCCDNTIEKCDGCVLQNGRQCSLYQSIAAQNTCAQIRQSLDTFEMVEYEERNQYLARIE